MKKLFLSITAHSKHLMVFLMLMVSVTSFAEIYTDSQGVRYNYYITQGFQFLASVVSSPDAQGDIKIPQTIRVNTYFYTTGWNYYDYTVLGVDTDAFKDNTKITSVLFDYGSQYISEGAFDGCTNLKTVTFKSKTPSFPKRFFKNCSSLESVTIPKTQTTIEDETFYGCSSLTSLMIPEGVQSVGKSAFQGCSNIKTLILPASLTQIGESAFAGCTYLRTIIDNALTPQPLGTNAFKDTPVMAIDLLVKYSSISDYRNAHDDAFDKMKIQESKFCIDGLYYSLTSDENVELTRDAENSYSGEITIPYTVTWSGYPFYVTGIGEQAFYNSSVTKVTLPIMMNYIGYGAFAGCSNLTSIYIPYGPTTIPQNAFQECTSLTQITLPSSLKTIEPYAFHSCSALKDITCKASTPPTISSDAFYNVSNLHSIMLTIPDNSNVLSAYLANTEWQKLYIVPQVVTYNNVKYKIMNRTEAKVCGLDPENTSGIYDIQPKVTFDEKEITTVAIADSAFFNAEIGSLTLPNTITSIGVRAFKNVKLPRLDIPASVRNLGKSSLFGNIDIVNIYSSDMTIDQWAFRGTYHAIRNYSVEPQTFNAEDIGSDIPLYVKDGSVKKYQAAEGWKNQNVIGMGTDENPVMLNTALFRNAIEPYEIKNVNSLVFTNYNADGSVSDGATFAASQKLAELNDGIRIFRNTNNEYAVATPIGVPLQAPLSCKSLFASFTQLWKLDLRGFYTSYVYDMSNMFEGCERLSSMVLKNFDMRKVQDKTDMFKSAMTSGIKFLDLYALPYLKDSTFNSISWYMVSYDLKLDDNTIVYGGTENHLPAATKYVNVPSYTREMSNQWGTVVVPFAVKYNANNGGYKLYKHVNASSTAITFDEYEDKTTIPAGTPMAIKAIGGRQANGKYAITLTANDNSVNTTITPTNAGNLSMEGTYEKVTNKKSVFFIAQDKFWLAEDAISIAPFRAWFEYDWSGEAKSLSIIVEDEDDITGIKEISPLVESEGAGKYLENGRVIIKKNNKKYNLNGQETK